jgi:hypothetical protein
VVRFGYGDHQSRADQKVAAGRRAIAGGQYPAGNLQRTSAARGCPADNLQRSAAQRMSDGQCPTGKGQQPVSGRHAGLTGCCPNRARFHAQVNGASQMRPWPRRQSPSPFAPPTEASHPPPCCCGSGKAGAQLGLSGDALEGLPCVGASVARGTQAQTGLVHGELHRLPELTPNLQSWAVVP